MSQFDSRADLAGGGSDPRPAPSDDAPSVDSTGHPRRSGWSPSVAGSGLGGGGLVAVGSGAVALGVVVFLWMSSHRPHPQTAPAPEVSSAVATPEPAAAPPDIVAMEAASRAAKSAPAPVAQIPPPPAPPMVSSPPPQPAPAPAAAALPHSPALVVDLADGAPATTTAAAAAKDGAATAAKVDRTVPVGLTADEQFAARIETGSEPDHARATVLHNKGSVVAQGAMIPAVLETALDSDLPGFARAVVSRDVRSFDGLAVLIPRGSRVIGEYRPAAAQGQTRAFVIWTRVLRPDGVSIQIGSPATDPLGRAGLSGSVDNHFFERFSGAILLTVINAGATALAGTPSTEVVVGTSSGLAGATGAASAFAPANIAPTIRVPQGSPIRIFVARDLEFSLPGSP